MKNILLKPALRRLSGLLFASAFFLCVLPLWSQSDAPSQFARTYPYPVETVKRALGQIGGFGGAKLPVVDGFVSSVVADADHYERPYYQYRVQLDQGDGTATTVKVEARITAWYAGADAAHSQYRSLPSNGRLENDLLDRLQDALSPSGTKPAIAVPVKANPPGLAPAGNSNHTNANPAPTAKPASPVKPATPATPQEQLDALLAQRQEVREKTAAMVAKLDAQKTANDSSETAKFASVKHSGVGVMSRKNFGGPVLFRAQVEDEFEVQSAESGWATVKLADGSTGFIQADELNLPPGLVEKPAPVAADATVQPAKASDPDLDFWVSREDVNVFSGDWARLKGKKVLFVYAQPRGLLSDIAGDDAKLAYAKRVFTNRLHSVDQAATGVEGVVVVFMGNRGGIAAATLTDIQQWVTGSIGDEAFVNRCSLDPPTEFRRIHLK